MTTRFTLEGPDDLDAPRPGRWTRLKEMIGLGHYDDEEEGDTPPEPVRRRGSLLRLHSSRTHQIVKISIRSLADARRATDMLKDRLPVILNLEHTEEESARRAVDFVSGAAYALDGYYERVGEKIFLFTPSTVLIASEDEEAAASTRALYTDGR